METATRKRTWAFVTPCSAVPEWVWKEIQVGDDLAFRVRIIVEGRSPHEETLWGSLERWTKGKNPIIHLHRPQDAGMIVPTEVMVSRNLVTGWRPVLFPDGIQEAELEAAKERFHRLAAAAVANRQVLKGGNLRPDERAYLVRMGVIKVR